MGGGVGGSDRLYLIKVLIKCWESVPTITGGGFFWVVFPWCLAIVCPML